MKYLNQCLFFTIGQPFYYWHSFLGTVGVCGQISAVVFEHLRILMFYCWYFVLFHVFAWFLLYCTHVLLHFWHFGSRHD